MSDKIDAPVPLNKEPSLSVSQSSDIEMTDEQNMQSSVSEEKPLDEAMKEEADLIEGKLEDLVAMMPGKLQKVKTDGEQPDYKNQKLLEQKIQKFKT